MKRRDALKFMGIAAGSAVMPTFPYFEYRDLKDDQDVLQHIEQLRGEVIPTSVVRVERGGPRFFVNDKEEYPFFAGSSGLIHTIKSFKESGIKFFHPLIGLEDGWLGPNHYDWSKIDQYYARLLELVPDALFLPRLHLYAPLWWMETHPEELVRCGLDVDKKFLKMPRINIDSNLNWNCLIDAYSASLASELWKNEMTDTLRAYIRHVESSPLRSRIIGYHIVGGMTAEWHYPGSRFLPDYSAPMQRKAGPIPSVEARMKTTNGLLRDPERERDVIEFYRAYHENTAETVAQFARAVKEETKGRIVCGTFFGYVLENVCIQEAGHLVPEKVLTSSDIDYLACPYTYQHGNAPGKERWESDLIDDSGTWLGRARGVGGDGGFRILLESLKRHKKLFISELDPSTYLEPTKTTEGGSGFQTIEGTLQILRRDLAQVFSVGCGGWLFEFGHTPSFKANRGWYDDAPMVKEIRTWTDLGKHQRSKLETHSIAEIAAVYDVKSFLVTQHWKAEEPWQGFGISISDFFNHWFLNSQARTLRRIGAPIDFLYRSDLVHQDISRYKLLFMPNLFYLTQQETERLKAILKDSGATVVWYYAPGYISPERFDQKQMENLTGFAFKRVDTPGPMMIEYTIDEPQLKAAGAFGVKKEHFPRFVINGNDPSVHTLGRWTDLKETAFAWREHDGFKSYYVGSAPLTTNLLRWIATKTGATLWSSKPDVVRGTHGAAMLTAQDDGERILRLPKPMASIDGGKASTEYKLDLKFGDVKVFIA